jgi:hypothetical protein
LRRVSTAIAEHGVDGVVVIAQGNLICERLDAAGAQPRNQRSDDLSDILSERFDRRFARMIPRPDGLIPAPGNAANTIRSAVVGMV